jgi:hypothetical protein
MPDNARFSMLASIATGLTWMGWALVVLSVLYLLVATGKVFGTKDPMWNAVLHFGPGGLAAIAGFFTVAVGESIGVAFAIEANTRGTREALQEVGHRLDQETRTQGPSDPVSEGGEPR